MGSGSREWVGECSYFIEFETWNTLSELERNEEYTLHHELVEQYVLDCFMRYHMKDSDDISNFEIEWYEIEIKH